MKTKFLGLLSWKQSGSSSFSLNKFNSQANKDRTHNPYGMVWVGAAAAAPKALHVCPYVGRAGPKMLSLAQQGLRSGLGLR